VSIQLHAPAVLEPIRYEVGWAQSRSRRSSGKKISASKGNRTPVVQPIVVKVLISLIFSEFYEINFWGETNSD
jgi:hypothetical protein